MAAVCSLRTWPASNEKSTTSTPSALRTVRDTVASGWVATRLATSASSHIPGFAPLGGCALGHDSAPFDGRRANRKTATIERRCRWNPIHTSTTRRRASRYRRTWPTMRSPRVGDRVRAARAPYGPGRGGGQQGRFGRPSRRCPPHRPASRHTRAAASSRSGAAGSATWCAHWSGRRCPWPSLSERPPHLVDLHLGCPRRAQGKRRAQGNDVDTEFGGDDVPQRLTQLCCSVPGPTRQVADNRSRLTLLSR